MEDFNIFKVLNKDDKELIHSAFFRFMLKNSDDFARKLISVSTDDIKDVKLEHGVKKKRFDLWIELRDGTCIIIENKFKSFPDEKQLLEYDRCVKTEKIQQRILVCFDKSLVNFETKWRVVDYSEILQMLNNSDDSLNPEQQMFVKHYQKFLNSYFEKYTEYLSNCFDLFKNSKLAENNFWLKLIFSSIRNQFAASKTKKISYVIATNTIVPLLNIIPAAWKENKTEILIQFQGDLLKFYAHTNDKIILEKYICIAKNIWTEDADFKKLNRRECKTNYIYKENILNIATDKEQLSINQIVDYLNDFYEKIDAALILKNS